MDQIEFTIKDDKLAKIIEAQMAVPSGNPNYKDMTDQQACEDLVATYAMDIVGSGWSVDKYMDFTYETLKELPVAAAACYRRYTAEEHKKYGIPHTEAFAKSVAAYFFAIAMNEHGCGWKMQKIPTFLINSKAVDPSSLWGVFKVTTDTQRGADFLQSVNEGCRIIGNNNKLILTLDVSALIRDYRLALGVDLRKHGLSNIAIEL